jgi:lipopolysaccharide transport system ATP-binding protein
MKSRLAFAIATAIDPEILIIDEVLSVGDASFARKAGARMKEICDKGRILVLVSHGLGSIVQMCSRCLWMEDGRVVMDGCPKEVTEAYRASVRERDEKQLLEDLKARLGPRSFADGIEMPSLSLRDSKGEKRWIYDIGESTAICFSVVAESELSGCELGITVERSDGVLVLENRASRDGFSVGEVRGRADFEVSLDSIPFGKGDYELTASVIHESGDVLAEHRTVLRVEDIPGELEGAGLAWPVHWNVEPVKVDSGASA